VPEPVPATAAPNRPAGLPAVQAAPGRLTAGMLIRLGLAVLLMIVCSRVLYSNNSVESIFSVPYLQEGVYAAALAYALLRLPFLRTRNDLLIGVLAPLFVAAAMLISALFAKLSFGQPLTFGLLEERRVLGLLIALPLYDLLRDPRLRERHLFGAVAVAVVIVFAMSVIAQSQLTGTIGGREGRFRTVGYFFALMSLFLLHRRLTVGGWWSALLLLPCAYAIIFISQTRMVSFGLVLAGLFLLLSARPLLSVLLAFVAPAALLVLTLVRPETFDFLNDADAFADASAQVRLYALSFFSDLLAQNGYLAGIGALSLQWKDGFHGLASGQFREHVFLSDLGLFGEYCRYGLLVLPLFALLAVILLSGRPSARGHGRRFYNAVLVFVALCSPTLGTFSGQGESLALLLALGLCMRRFGAAERTGNGAVLRPNRKEAVAPQRDV
jgi:hypothetical protein